jgi:hypothetical protein
MTNDHGVGEHCVGELVDGGLRVALGPREINLTDDRSGGRVA